MLKMKRFKIGDKIKILSTSSSISGNIFPDNKTHYGAKTGDIRIIEGITDRGGNATKTDPRYYGIDFNGRACDLELVDSVVNNNYEIY